MPGLEGGHAGALRTVPKEDVPLLPCPSFHSSSWSPEAELVQNNSVPLPDQQSSSSAFELRARSFLYHWCLLLMLVAPARGRDGEGCRAEKEGRSSLP